VNAGDPIPSASGG